MSPDNSFDVGQRDARAFEILYPVQTLENSKQLVGISHIEPNPVVLNEEDQLVITPAVADFDAAEGFGRV